MGKALSYDEIARRQEQAVNFLLNVVGDPDKAEEIESLSVEEYAERKGFALANPSTPTRSEKKMETVSCEDANLEQSQTIISAAGGEADAALESGEPEEMRKTLQYISDICNPDSTLEIDTEDDTVTIAEFPDGEED
jgi:hypothetical protein